jgi:hypothetical protein
MMPALLESYGALLMVKENDYVAIFHSIHRVLKAEKILKQEQQDFLLIPEIGRASCRERV